MIQSLLFSPVCTQQMLFWLSRVLLQAYAIFKSALLVPSRSSARGPWLSCVMRLGSSWRACGCRCWCEKTWATTRGSGTYYCSGLRLRNDQGGCAHWRAGTGTGRAIEWIWGTSVAGKFGAERWKFLWRVLWVAGFFSKFDFERLCLAGPAL